MNLQDYINSYKREHKAIANNFDISDDESEQLFYKLADKYYAISMSMENVEDEIALETFIETYYE